MAGGARCTAAVEAGGPAGGTAVGGRRSRRGGAVRRRRRQSSVGERAREEEPEEGDVEVDGHGAVVAVRSGAGVAGGEELEEAEGTGRPWRREREER